MKILNATRNGALALTLGLGLSLPAEAARTIISTDWSLGSPDAPYVLVPAMGGQLTLQPDVLIVFRLANISVTPVGTATVAGEGSLWNFKLRQVELDGWTPDGTEAIDSISFEGGWSWTIPNPGLGGGPGTLTMTNLRVDIPSNTIYADLEGAGVVSGPTPLLRFASISISPLTGNLQDGTSFEAIISGLAWRPEGVSALTQSLALSAFGANVLGRLSWIGSLRVGPIPEPSTWALAALGLSAALAAARKRVAQG